MDTYHLRLFVEVARHGSFAEVARLFDADPSSVSRAMASLEDELGSRLLQRSTRRVALTEAGHLYLARVAPVVEELDMAKDQLAATLASPQGNLRMTASVAFGTRCLVPLLPPLRAAFPQLQLDLWLTDDNVDLVAQRIDLAVRLGTQLQVDAVGVKFMRTTYRVCASPSYVAQCRRKKLKLAAPQDLSLHRCLRFSLQDFRTRWRFRALEAQGRAEPDVTQDVIVDGDIVISSALALHQATLQGLGPCLLPNWLIDEDIAAGRLVHLLPGYQATATDFDTGAWLLYPSRSYLPSKTRAVIEFLKQRLGPLDGP